jgi:hypothetical protein
MLFLPNGEAENFLRKGWTNAKPEVRLICPSGSFRLSSSRRSLSLHDRRFHHRSTLVVFIARDASMSLDVHKHDWMTGLKLAI